MRSGSFSQEYVEYQIGIINQIDYSPVLYYFSNREYIDEPMIEKTVTKTYAEAFKIEEAFVTAHQTDLKTFSMGQKRFDYENKMLIVKYNESDLQGGAYSDTASAEAVKQLQINQERALWYGVDSMSTTFNTGYLTSENVIKEAEYAATSAAALFMKINQTFSDVKKYTQSNSPSIALGMTNGVRNALDVVSSQSGTTFASMLEQRYGQIYIFESFVFGADDFYIVSNPTQNVAILGANAKPMGTYPIDHEYRTEYHFGRTTIALNCLVKGSAIIQPVDASGVLPS